MGVLKDWTCKGFDLTYDGLSHGDSIQKNFVLYPKGYSFSILGVNHANSCEGINERIKIIDDAILKASKV